MSYVHRRYDESSGFPPPPPDTELWQMAQAGLQKFWGYSSFRPLQREIITAQLKGQDVLALLPTGAGKSLCFQLPALIRPGLTLVISPLLALMENQVQSFHPPIAAALHSELSPSQRQQTFQQLERGQLKLLYIAPESLLSEKVWTVLQNLPTPLQTIVIDEAHCISQWGSSFRPAYRRLGVLRTALQAQHSPLAIAAFTATATTQMQAEITQVLLLKHPQVFRSSPYRRNLQLQIERVFTPARRRRKLLEFLQQQGQSSGLIYTRSRRDSETLAIWFKQQGYATEAYHAGLLPQERRSLEQQWLTGGIPFVICTSAFGMGVDKPDCRWVAHLHPPLTLAEYVQEVGRAGRDQLPAKALLLASECTGLLDPSDRRRNESFLKQLRLQQLQAVRLRLQLPEQGRIEEVRRKFPRADLALAMMHSIGLVQWEDPFHYRLDKTILDSKKLLFPPTVGLEPYLRTSECRWRFILKAFGFEREAQGLRCGHCDRCSIGNQFG
jgi:ATP-dependent DNA helicase RecQ